MRALTLDELEDQVIDQHGLIMYADSRTVDEKVNQFLNFLESQPIAKRNLERIEEDFPDLKEKIHDFDFDNRRLVNIKAIKSDLFDLEVQGAFAYFNLAKIKTNPPHGSFKYLILPEMWDYKGTHDYDIQQQSFNDHFWEPFGRILKWYLYESRPKDYRDYFSYETRNEIVDKIDQLMVEIRDSFDLLNDGQTTLYLELQDLQDYTGTMNQKSWAQLTRVKVDDLATAAVLNSTQAKSLLASLLEMLPK